ncbi:MAG TPA: hypothetical protein VHB21_04480 [Minicystis sp.]|nr:hypothetical protein [Minicystis sp.]
MQWREGAAAAGITALVVVLPVGPRAAQADEAPAAPCEAWQIEYAVNANVNISDTLFGGGDGTYPNGPGKVVLRFEDVDGAPGGHAKLVEYTMHDTFTVVSHGLFWEARVTASAVSHTTPNASGAAAEGVLDGRTLRWNGPWTGMRTDGALLCSGALCGRFGAPPEGRSDLHVAPHPVRAQPFEFAPDFKTFRMPYAIVSQQSSPRQTSRIQLAAREVRRTCASPRSSP